MVTVKAGAGRLQEMMRTWNPAVWLMTTRVSECLPVQRLYSADKSAAVTAGSGLEQAGASPRAHMPSLTMLTHVGETRKARGGGGGEKMGWSAGTQR